MHFCSRLELVQILNHNSYAPPNYCVENAEEFKKHSGNRVVLRGTFKVERETPLQVNIHLKDGFKVLLDKKIDKDTINRFEGKKIRISGSIWSSQPAYTSDTEPIKVSYITNSFPIFHYPRCALDFIRDCPCKLSNHR